MKKHHLMKESAALEGNKDSSSPPSYKRTDRSNTCRADERELIRVDRKPIAPQLHGAIKKMPQHRKKRQDSYKLHPQSRQSNYSRGKI